MRTLIRIALLSVAVLGAGCIVVPVEGPPPPHYYHCDYYRCH